MLYTAPIPNDSSPYIKPCATVIRIGNTVLTRNYSTKSLCLVIS